MLAYNENGRLQNYPETNRIVECKSCKKRYLQWVVNQVPGFRDKDYDVCPYCGYINGSSMDEEYSNHPLDE